MTWTDRIWCLDTLFSRTLVESGDTHITGESNQETVAV